MEIRKITAANNVYEIVAPIRSLATYIKPLATRII